MDPKAPDLDQQIKERFKTLPPIVQQAITSADVQEHLRGLATTHKLHLDQWQVLENEVMLALLGFQPTEDLQKNIKSEVGLTDEAATALAGDISKTVFEPIRGEMERTLEHPEAKAAEVSDVETARREAISSQSEVSPPAGTPSQAPAAAAPAQAASATPPVVPATPPPSPPTEKAVRAPLSSAYKAGEPSTVRASVHDDPYREPPQ